VGSAGLRDHLDADGSDLEEAAAGFETGLGDWAWNGTRHWGCPSRGNLVET
jgi:hypothetical protein